MRPVTSRWHHLRSLLLVDDAAQPGAALPDAVILDRPAGRPAPRASETTADWARRWRAGEGGPLLLVGVEMPEGEDHEQALDVAMAARPDAILLRGDTGMAAIQHLGVKLAVREALHGWAAGAVAIVADCGGTPGSLPAASHLVGASPRLVALTWDADRLATACGGDATVFAAAEGPGAVVRTALALAAGAASIAAYDTALPAGIKGPCALARQLGFSGGMTRDADDIAALNALFARTSGP